MSKPLNHILWKIREDWIIRNRGPPPAIHILPSGPGNSVLIGDRIRDKEVSEI